MEESSMSNRLNYWSLLAQEHEQEVIEATRESDIPRAIRATMAMTHALTNAQLTEERGE
jgi:hypothetical protein